MLRRHAYGVANRPGSWAPMGGSTGRWSAPRRYSSPGCSMALAGGSGLGKSAMRSPESHAASLGQASSQRQDIQVLRGIAVLAVLLYHSGIAPLKAGYLGFDVFFVFSGFRITKVSSPISARIGSHSPASTPGRLGSYCLRPICTFIMSSLLRVKDPPDGGPLGRTAWHNFLAPSPLPPTSFCLCNPATSKPTQRPSLCCTLGHSLSKSSTTCWYPYCSQLSTRAGGSRHCSPSPS